MPISSGKLAALAGTLALGIGGVGWAGCGDDENASELVEEGAKTVTEGAERAGDAVGEGARTAGDAAEDAGDAAGEGAEEAGKAAEEAGGAVREGGEKVGDELQGGY